MRFRCLRKPLWQDWKRAGRYGRSAPGVGGGVRFTHEGLTGEGGTELRTHCCFIMQRRRPPLFLLSSCTLLHQRRAHSSSFSVATSTSSSSLSSRGGCFSLTAGDADRDTASVRCSLAFHFQEAATDLTPSSFLQHHPHPPPPAFCTLSACITAFSVSSSSLCRTEGIPAQQVDFRSEATHHQTSVLLPVTPLLLLLSETSSIQANRQYPYHLSQLTVSLSFDSSPSLSPALTGLHKFIAASYFFLTSEPSFEVTAHLQSLQSPQSSQAVSVHTHTRRRHVSLLHFRPVRSTQSFHPLKPLHLKHFAFSFLQRAMACDVNHFKSQHVDSCLSCFGLVTSHIPYPVHVPSLPHFRVF